MTLFYFIVLLCSLVLVHALNVTNIKDCPSLTPRSGPANVRDLRVDDIKVIGALGDSVTAGFGIMGFDESAFALIAAITSLFEYRGLSYGIGGDDGAFTVPNYIKHYQPNIVGYSTGKHITEYCSGPECLAIYLPDDDRLNAAQTGSFASNLNHQLDYLIPHVKVFAAANYANDWKMINIQIGSNDMCGACDPAHADDVTPEKYGAYVEAAIERIRANISKVLINLIGTFKVSHVFPVTEGKNYCLRSTKNATNTRAFDLCSCSTAPDGLAKMDQLSDAYNTQLYNIYQKYQQNPVDDFAVVYQQSNIEFASFPIDAFSDFDCFHPSLKGHQWISKILWNQLFTNQGLKPKQFNFNENEAIYCPTDSDRIVTN